MRFVNAATGAVLVHFEPLLVILLILLGDIVMLFAFLARKSHYNSIFGSRHFIYRSSNIKNYAPSLQKGHNYFITPEFWLRLRLRPCARLRGSQSEDPLPSQSG